METLKKYFDNADEVVQAVYANGGIKVHWWGFLSGWFGWWIEQNQALSLIYLDWFMAGLQVSKNPDRKQILRELNAEMTKKGVPEENLPFINLD